MRQSASQSGPVRSLPLLGAAFLLLASRASAQEGVPLGTVAGLSGLLGAEGAVRFEAGWAIPLAAARPAWLTPDLERRVIEAAGLPVAAPGDAPLPGVVGIRPGAWMVAPHGCTMNFVFRRGGELLIGTAGHCVDLVGQEVVILALGPGSDQPVLVNIGTVAALRDNGVGDDFALVSIRPELSGWVSATTAVIGGPCAPYEGAGPEAVLHYGHGTAIGAGGTPRAGVALVWEADHFAWASPAIFGDSGSPVEVSDLGAAGDLTHLIVDALWLPSFVAGTRIQKMLRLVEGLEIAQSPLCGPGGGGTFIRGDANQDRKLNIADPVTVLQALFVGDALLVCRDAADSNDDGAVQLTDGIYLLSYLFLGGSPPAEPFPEPGPDPTPDLMGDC